MIIKTIHAIAVAATGMLCKDGFSYGQESGEVKDLPIFRVRMVRA